MSLLPGTDHDAKGAIERARAVELDHEREREMLQQRRSLSPDDRPGIVARLTAWLGRVRR
jgi:hypothetical protein